MAHYINKVQDLLEEKGIDAVLLKSKTMKKYLNTLTGSGCQILITRQEGFIFLDGRYLEEAQQAEHQLTICLIQKDMTSEIMDCLKKIGCKSIACEDAFISVQTYKRLMESFDVHLWNEELSLLRMVKEKEEIEHLQLAIDWTDKIFDIVRHQIRIGMTEFEISALLQYHAIAIGAQQMSFDTIVTSGPRTAFPHGRPTARKIGAHEPIMIDFGIQYRRYQSDMTRMIFVDTPTEKMLHIYQTVHKAQLCALSGIREGVVAKEVDRIARNIIQSEGYGQYFSHGLGHGIGIGDGSEYPYLNQRSQIILKENMVMSCEPGVYIPGIGGVRIEDDVWIHNGKGVPLNKTTKELCVIKG